MEGLDNPLETMDLLNFCCGWIFFSRFLFLKISFASLQFNAVGYKSATKIYNLLRFFLLSVKSEKLLANRLGDVITSGYGLVSNSQYGSFDCRFCQF